MQGVPALIRDVEWTSPVNERLYSATHLTIDTRLEAVVRRVSKDETLQAQARYVQALLFGVPGWQRGDGSLPDEAVPIDRWRRLPDRVQTWKHQGRGIGLRMYNSPNAAVGAAERYSRIGLYSVALDTESLLDMTGRPDWRVKSAQLRVAFQARWYDDAQAVALSEARLGADAEFIMYDQPPAGRAVQREQGITPGNDDRLYVLRSPELFCRKLGEVSIPTAQLWN